MLLPFVPAKYEYSPSPKPATSQTLEPPKVSNRSFAHLPELRHVLQRALMMPDREPHTRFPATVHTFCSAAVNASVLSSSEKQ